MLEKIKNLFLENLGLKMTALVLAVLVWAAVTGRERADSEKTLRVPVELTNVSESIEVRSVKPEEVSLSLHGASQIINGISQQNLKIRIDLKDTVKSGRINFYAEDHLKIPEGIHILSVHPKMIEINVEEFVIREIPVKIHFIGRLKSGLTLKEARVNPEKVTVIGFRPQITEIDINLHRTAQSGHRRKLDQSDRRPEKNGEYPQISSSKRGRSYPGHHREPKNQ